jgi:serine phosphatase RsbU (regulator of sigma subunit)
MPERRPDGDRPKLTARADDSPGRSRVSAHRKGRSLAAEGPYLSGGDRLRALARTGLDSVPDEALDRYARMVQTYLGVPTALVSLVDSARQFFPGAAGLREPWDSTRETPLTHSICQYVVGRGEPVVSADIRADPELSASLANSVLGVVAYAGMPLTDGHGNILGVLCAIDTEPRIWANSELSALADLAAACSSEIRLRTAAASAQAAEREAAEAAQRMSLTAEATLILSSSLNLDTSMARLVELLVPKFADWAVVSLVGDDGKIEQIAHAHRDGFPDQMERYAAMLAVAASGTSPTRAVLSGGPPQLLPVVTDDDIVAASDDPDMLELTRVLGCASFIAVPLTARGRTLGAIGLTGVDRTFDKRDLEMAIDLGARAGLAIDNGRLYVGQRRVAETLQRGMLTELPEPDHLHLVSRYRASADDAQVGGDWYDAFLQPDGSTVLVIGDVMGHDISAAASMGQLRNLLRGTAYDRGDSPANVLQRVDAAIRGLGVDALATCVVARIEQTEQDAAAGVRTLRWSNAGHPPPMLLQPDGTVIRLDAEPDLMLGVQPLQTRQDHVAVLPTGGVLLMFTDGLVEHRELSLDDGLDALAAALRGRQDAPLDDLCDAAIEALVPNETSDDVALIAVRAMPHEGPRPVEAGPADYPRDRPDV